MALESVRVRWVAASGYLNTPEPRCGHVATSINSRDVWGEEFLVVHGGINKNKDALEDLVVLQYAQEAWFQPGPAAVGPAARAFHAGCAIDRKLYIFGGHVYVKQQHKLHQFNDLWALNTDTWEWSRVETSPDAPQPCPRDRATMIPLAPTKLLLYGGADSLNRRLDDLWVFDLSLGTWSEVKPAGAKPRPRCCTSLVVAGDEILMFGGDSYGVSSELWSLKGVVESDTGASQDSPQDLPPQWTQLSLEGPSPAPRRGHAVAVVGQRVVYMGGLTEQKSMLGMKSRNEYLADVVVLDREAERVSWRGVEVAEGGEGPAPREKHSLTALAGGRLLLFGGTDGTTTLGDAWWLHLEDIVAPTPQALSESDLPQGDPFTLTPAAQRALAEQYDAQQQQYMQYQLQYNQQRGTGQAPGPGPGGWGPTTGGAVLAGVDPTAAKQAGQVSAGGASAGFSYLPSTLASTLPAVVPSGLSTAFNSFRERLGLPSASPSAAAPPPGAETVVGQPLGGPAAAQQGPPAQGGLPSGGSGTAAARYCPTVGHTVQGVPAGGPPPALPLASTHGDPFRDEGLLAVGQRALLRTLGQEGGRPREAAEEGEALLPPGGWSQGELVLAARQFLASCKPEDLLLGDLPVLMADYRRLARVGWAQAVRERGGLEALLQGQGGGGGADLLQMPGRFLHLAAEDLRLREVPQVLADYQMLLALHVPDTHDVAA